MDECGGGDFFRLVDMSCAISLACSAADAPGEIGNARCEDEDRSDAAEHGSCPCGRSEEGSGNDVLNLWRAWQGIHGKAESTEREGRRNQALWDESLPEHLGGKRIYGEDYDEQRHSTVGKKGTDQHYRQHGPTATHHSNDGRHDGLCEA